MTCRHHHIHTEQRREHEHAELTGIMAHLVSGKPRLGGEDDNDCTSGKNGLHHSGCLGRDIKTTERFASAHETADSSRGDKREHREILCDAQLAVAVLAKNVKKEYHDES